MAKKKRKTTGKSSLTLSLSSQARDRLSEMSQKAGYSRSAFVEKMMAGQVSIAGVEPEKSLAFIQEEGNTPEPKISLTLVENTTDVTIAPSAEPEQSVTQELEQLQAKIAEQAQEIELLKQQKEVSKQDSPSLKAPPTRPQPSKQETVQKTVELNKKDEKIATLTQQLANAEKTVEKVQAELSQKATEITELTAQVEAKATALATAENSSETLQGQITELSNVLATKEQTLAQLQEDFEQREVAIKAHQEHNATLEKQVQEQDARVTAFAQEVAAQKAQVEQLTVLQAELAQAKAEGDRLQGELAQAKQSQETALTTAKEQAQAEIQAITAQKDQLATELATTVQEKATLTSELQAQQRRLNSATDLQNQYNASQQQLRLVQAQLNQASTTQAQYDQLRRQFQEQGDRLKSLEEELAISRSFAAIGDSVLNRWKR